MHGALILALCLGWLAAAPVRDRLRAQARAHRRRPAVPDRSPRP
ncbi:hypothetical protein [Methylobacterium mesophilicum]|nr:hypothetical protein [Methylobacterium mesophilicum]